MPFRDAFECLWCGRPHTVRDRADIEGWAQLCPDCIGRAGDNGFLRFRLKNALAERARQARPPELALPSGPSDPHPAGAETTPDAPASLDEEMVAYYEARAPEYDDFYLRRGRYARGAIDDMAWQVDLDIVTRWLDAQPIAGEIVELAGGTGWWSPLLAQKGELSVYDAADAPLDRARERLLAHGLRAHLHVRDAWAEPDRQVDVLFAGFWLSHVPRERLSGFIGLARRWLKPGGAFIFIDSQADPRALPDSKPPEVSPEVQLRSLDDGRAFRVVKVHYAPRELEDALRQADFGSADVGATSRFFLFGRAVAE